MRKVLVLGGPGGGKTERLLRKVDAALERGVPPGRIAFVSFMRNAVSLAKARAVDMFGIDPNELINFRTTHSLALRELGLRRGDVLDDEHLNEVSKLTGELLTSLEDPFSDAPAAGRNADPLLTLDHYARTTGRGLRTAWGDHGSEVDWWRLLRFSKAYAAYKDDTGVIDFTDMLTRYADSPFAPVDVDVAIVDEAQDLTREQWRVVMKAFANVEELYVGGDDMQMIHHWAGADEEKFLALKSEGFELENLPMSHRLPIAVFNVAEAVGQTIGKRYTRAWRPSARQGAVDWVARIDEIDLTKPPKDPKKLAWLMLARTRAQLPALAKAARGQGVVYEIKGEKSVRWPDVVAIRAHETLRAGGFISREDSVALGIAAKRSFESFEGVRDTKALNYDATAIWHDALVGIEIGRREYYLAVLRRGGKLTDDAKVRIETIHGAKGAEAEGVVLSTDWTHRTARAAEIDPDSEARVMYVGLTRASERLVLVAPETSYGYRM